MTPTYTGQVVRVDSLSAYPTALAGSQMKLGLRRIAGSGRITRLAILDGEDPCGVEVEGVGDVPLAAVRDVDAAELRAWWWRELAAWCGRRGVSVDTEDHAAVMAAVTLLRARLAKGAE